MTTLTGLSNMVFLGGLESMNVGVKIRLQHLDSVGQMIKDATWSNKLAKGFHLEKWGFGWGCVVWWKEPMAKDGLTKISMHRSMENMAKGGWKT